MNILLSAFDLDLKLSRLRLLIVSCFYTVRTLRVKGNYLTHRCVCQGVKVDFPPSKLKSGSGEHVCFVLDRLAEEALRRRGFSFRRYSNISKTNLIFPVLLQLSFVFIFLCFCSLLLITCWVPSQVWKDSDIFRAVI